MVMITDEQLFVAFNAVDECIQRFDDTEIVASFSRSRKQLIRIRDQLDELAERRAREIETER